MLLGKNCKKKYNVKNGTIKLGTLDDYRTTEITELRDEKEGTLSFNLNFEGDVVVSTELLNTILSGALHLGDNASNIAFPGKFRAHLHNFKKIYNDPMFTTLRDTTITIQRESLNSFIFCTSKIKKMSEAVGLFEGYDDCWYLMHNRADQFGKTLGQILLNRIITGHHNGEHIVPKDTNIETLQIFMQHSEIEYIPREINISKNASITVQEFMKKIETMAFVKPDDFSTEREYRFNYTIISNNSIIEPSVKHITLDSTPLLDLII